MNVFKLEDIFFFEGKIITIGRVGLSVQTLGFVSQDYGLEILLYKEDDTYVGSIEFFNKELEGVDIESLKYTLLEMGFKVDTIVED